MFEDVFIYWNDGKFWLYPPLAKKKLSKKIAQWSSVGVNIYFKQLTTASYWPFGDFHLERDWFQFVVFQMLQRLDESFHFKFLVLFGTECVDRYAA